MIQIQVSLLHKIILIVFILLSISIGYAQFAGGNGTETDPFLIQSADQLNNIRDHLTSDFKQIADIDLGVAPYNQGEGFQPIGYITSSSSFSGTPFTGSFDGNGFIINNLFINRPDYSFNGLFRFTQNAVLKNIRLINCNLTSSYYAGCLIAIAHYTTVSNCQIIGNVSAGNTDGMLIGRAVYSNVTDCSTRGSLTSICWDSGGLIGNVDNSTITRCYSGVTVSGSGWTGGLIGFSTYSTISCCWTESTVTGTSEEAGGFIGELLNSNCSNSFSTGAVNGNEIVGGFCGRTRESTIFNCYSTGLVQGLSRGGFVASTQTPGGEKSGNYTNCYWDTQTSGQPTSAVGIGLTTSEMIYPYANQSYSGWDFDIVWVTDQTRAINSGYPFLQGLPNHTPKPVLNPRPGNYSTPIVLVLMAAIPDAEIHYTLDGSEPTEQSALYTSYIVIDSSFTVKAQSYKYGWFASEIVTGSYNVTVNAEDESDVPQLAKLFSAYPNPFNPNTTIRFSLPKDNAVSLIVYNLKGQQIRTLAYGSYKKGEQSFQWDGTDSNGKAVPSGVYVYKLKGKDVEFTRKMTLMK